MFRHTKLKPYCSVIALSLLLGISGQANAEADDHPLYYVEEGEGANANGVNAIAIGAGATALGEESIAIGARFRRAIGGHLPLGAHEYAPVAKNGGIAIGTGSRSNKAGDVNFGSRKLSGLLDGVADDEAVTMRQLKAAQSNLANSGSDVAGGDGSQGSSTLSEAKAYADTSTSQAVSAANAYTDLMKQEALADGKAYTDQRLSSIPVVDEGKLLTTASEFTEMRSKQAQEYAVGVSRRYTDERFSQMQSQMKRLSKRANAGISGAMAMTALTPPPTGTNTSFGMAMAGYRKQLAIATGATFRLKDNQNIRLNTSWDSSGGLGIAAGFNMAW